MILRQTNFHSLPIVSAADIEPDKPLISANVFRAADNGTGVV